MSSFSASWGTKCANPDCGTGWVAEGDLAHYARPGSKDIEHVTCPQDLKVGTVCPRCFLEVPVSGVCGTCD